MPETQFGFHRALFDLGYQKPEQREKLIKEYAVRWPGLLEDRQREFYGRVLTELAAGQPREGMGGVRQRGV